MGAVACKACAAERVALLADKLGGQRRPIRYARYRGLCRLCTLAARSNGCSLVSGLASVTPR